MQSLAAAISCKLMLRRARLSMRWGMSVSSWSSEPTRHYRAARRTARRVAIGGKSETRRAAKLRQKRVIERMRMGVDDHRLENPNLPCKAFALPLPPPQARKGRLAEMTAKM
jgi:hypothetical protein